jgi:transcriptional regulator with XRE-family HTH domain
MTFSEKLKQAMQELHLNQRQVCGMTGKSKGSVSQYLSGKQVPNVEVQSSIATALGLEADYFERMDDQITILPSSEVRNGIIPKLLPEVAAKYLGMDKGTVRRGLQQGVFPWGYAVRTSENRWAYFINARRFAEIEGVSL